MSEKASSSSLLEAIKSKLGKLPKANEEAEKKSIQNYFSENIKDIPPSNNDSEKTELFNGIKNIENIENSSETSHEESSDEFQKDLDDESVNVKNISQKINNKTNLKEVNSAEIDEENSEEDLEEIKPQEQNPNISPPQNPQTPEPKIDPIELELQKLEAELEQKKKQQKPEIKIEDLDLTDQKPNDTQPTISSPSSPTEKLKELPTNPVNEEKNHIDEVVKNDEIENQENLSEVKIPDNNLSIEAKTNDLIDEKVTLNQNLNPPQKETQLTPQKPTEEPEDNFHELRSKISTNTSFNFSPTLEYLNEIEQKTTESSLYLEDNNDNSITEKNIEKPADLGLNQTNSVKNEQPALEEIKADIAVENEVDLKINPSLNNIDESPKINESKEPKYEIKVEDAISEIKIVESEHPKINDFVDLPIHEDEEKEEDFKIQNYENELIKNSMKAIKEELTSLKLDTKIHHDDSSNFAVKIDSLDNIEEDFVENSKLEKISHNLIHEETIYQSTNSIKKLMEAKNIVKKVNNSFTNDELLTKIAVNIMEPKLEKWLNDNLPNLVEEIVRKEIEKIIPN